MTNPKSDRKKLGNVGERFVINYLEKNGFTIFAQNYRKFFGEIDIIAYKERLYVFVEVKTRKKELFSLTDLIPPSKQRKIIKTAESFIAQQTTYDHYIFRFDVALLVEHDTTFSMQYLENAFTKQDSQYDY